MAKTLILNDDGWSSLMRHPAPMSPEDVVAATVAPLEGTGVGIYQLCALGGHAVHYRSAFLPKVGETMDRIDTLHVWRMLETLKHLEALGTDPLQIAAEACRTRGIACQFSLRMNDAHHTYRHPDGSWCFPELRSPWLEEHPELLLPTGQLDYARPEVHEYRLTQVAEVLEGYEVTGVDLDFTRFRPWFRDGAEMDGAPAMTGLVRALRQMTRERGRTLSARFEYDPQVCHASGLQVEQWLAEELLDQVTLGGIGDHTPDAPAGWWIERAHATGCRVYPGVEGQLHWISSCGGGGTGTHASTDGVHDGYGPPSIEYLRAVAAVHYADGADGLSLFNFTCADGPWPHETLTELAVPEGLARRSKQYVVAVWPWDAQIYGPDPWRSSFRLEPGQGRTATALRIADDPTAEVQATLTLDLKGLNRVDDVEVALNGVALTARGGSYDHYDHGCWNEVLTYPVPVSCLRSGDNELSLTRLCDLPGFDGDLEVRKCILDMRYPEDASGQQLGQPR